MNRVVLAVASLGLAAGAAVAVVPSAAQAAACGTWRWPVKTGADATRFQVSHTTSFTSVAYLDSLARPSSFGTYAQNHRIKWPEFRTWQINNTTLVAIKLEDDGDLHLRLRSSTGKTMIAEIPRPGCVNSASPWKSQIAAARSYITARYPASSSSWHYVYRKIDIKGLGFFDEEHNVTGRAPNQFELHPVIYIRLR